MSVSVAVITCGPSDLLALLQKSPALTVEVLHPNALTPHCLDGFQCACVLGAPGRNRWFSRRNAAVWWRIFRTAADGCCMNTP